VMRPAPRKAQHAEFGASPFQNHLAQTKPKFLRTDLPEKFRATIKRVVQ
jgi:hypothetical protein